MTELDLYKFITENNVEYSWITDDVIIWLYIFEVEAFAKLVDPDSVGDGNGGIDCKLQNNKIALKMGQICEYYGIELEKVFKK